MFHSLKNLIPKSVNRAKISGRVEIAMVLEEFEKVVKEVLGERAAQKSKPLYLKDKIITVAVLSSVLAQELRLNEGVIIKKLNGRFDHEVAKGLKYVV